MVPREAAAGHSRFWTGRIAAEIQGVMQEIGGEGFLIHDPLTRKAITEVRPAVWLPPCSSAA